MAASTAKSELVSGFVALSTEELVQVNGGRGSKDSSSSNSGSNTVKESKGSSGITSTDVKYVVARAAAEIVFIGNDNAEIKDAWAKAVSGKQ